MEFWELGRENFRQWGERFLQKFKESWRLRAAVFFTLAACAVMALFVLSDSAEGQEQAVLSAGSMERAGMEKRAAALPFVAAAGHWTGKICAILFWWSIRLRGSRNQDRQLPDRRQPGGGCQIARRIQELYKEKDRQQPVRCKQLPVPDRLLARQETGRIARKRIAAFSCRG